VQGEKDQYGTIAQIEAAQRECYCPVETAILPGVRHMPYREAPEPTITAIAAFINRLLRDHREADGPAPCGLAVT
jgi:pimeloyl-ACP methyl ester carboxylesterase